MADLDRVMTVEKTVVTRWKRVQGWITDDEARRFSEALARKRGRFAFPDDFVSLVNDLRAHIMAKHRRSSPEGQVLRALSEIRVAAWPSWNAQSVVVYFYFIPKDPSEPIEQWAEHLQRWVELVQPQGRYVEVGGAVKTLDELTAAMYVVSDRLDLDHLSHRGDAGAGSNPI